MKSIINILTGSIYMAPLWVVILIAAGCFAASSAGLNPGFGTLGIWSDYAAKVLGAIGGFSFVIWLYAVLTAKK